MMLQPDLLLQREVSEQHSKAYVRLLTSISSLIGKEKNSPYQVEWCLISGSRSQREVRSGKESVSG